MKTKRIVDFDIDRYLRNSKRLDLSQLDWADIPNHPLTDGDVMCLHYMMDIETHTVIYLRDLLATRAAHDPYVTGFLSCWVYEELWHGEAFSDFLRAYGLEVPAEPKLPDGSTPMPTRPNRVREFREQMGVGHKLFLLPTMFALDGDARLRRPAHDVGSDQRAHDADRLPPADAPLDATRCCTRCCAASSRTSGATSPSTARRRRRAWRATRARARWCAAGLKAFWTPVGAGVKSQEEVDALAIYLFGDSPEGREGAREIDETIAEIPGLEGLTLLEDALDAALARAAASPAMRA